MRHTSSTAEAAEQRHRGRDANEPAGFNRNDAPDEDLVARPEPRKREHHAEYACRSADDGCVRLKGERHERPRNTAHKVEREKPLWAEALLHARAEEIERDHVEQNVRETAVQKHVRHHRPRPRQNGDGDEGQRLGQPRHRLLHEVHQHIGDQQPLDPWGHGQSPYWRTVVARSSDSSTAVSFSQPASARSSRTRTLSSSAPILCACRTPSGRV